MACETRDFMENYVKLTVLQQMRFKIWFSTEKRLVDGVSVVSLSINVGSSFLSSLSIHPFLQLWALYQRENS